jgi:hypothetical protein
MTLEEKRGAASNGNDLPTGKIFAAAFYVITVLFILGFFWQSVAFLVLPS